MHTNAYSRGGGGDDRIFCTKGRVRLITAVNYSSCMFLLLFFYQLIMAPGLLALLQVRFFLFFFF